jgi:hypothetical protein
MPDYRVPICCSQTLYVTELPTGYHNFYLNLARFNK